MAEKPKLYPGPYAIEFTILAAVGSNAYEHKLELNCKVVGTPAAGAAIGSIDILKAGGGTQTAALCITDFWTQYKIGLTAGSTCTGVILWKYTPESYEKQFISAYTSALGTGSTGTTPIEGHQTQITLRSALGSYMRVNWLEDTQTAKNQVALVPLISGNAQQRVASYLLSVNGWAVARDGSFPVAGMKISYTQNEALDNKRFRPNT